LTIEVKHFFPSHRVKFCKSNHLLVCKINNNTDVGIQENIYKLLIIAVGEREQLQKYRKLTRGYMTVGGNQPIQLPYLPYGHLFIAASWYYPDGDTDVCGCLIGWFPPTL
jgi:hypothetical protein